MKNKINSYKDLIVWQKSMLLVNLIYKLTCFFPKEELYGLTSQMKRSAISIPSNIAEGKRRGGKEYKRFLIISFGSGAELETQIEIAKNQNFGNTEEYTEIEELLLEVMKMLNILIRKL
jgi:four helix bundle protein